MDKAKHERTLDAVLRKIAQIVNGVSSRLTFSRSDDPYAAPLGPGVHSPRIHFGADRTSPAESAMTTKPEAVTLGRLEGLNPSPPYNLNDLIGYVPPDNAITSQQLGVIYQYNPPCQNIREIGPIPLEEPVLPNGETILATIKALKQAGYDTKNISLIPSGREEAEQIDELTKDFLKTKQKVKYLAFALYFGKYSPVEAIAISRQDQFWGESNPGFTYRVGHKPGKPIENMVEQAMQTVTTTAFPYDKGDIIHNPFQADSIPSTRTADKKQRPDKSLPRADFGKPDQTRIETYRH